MSRSFTRGLRDGEFSSYECCYCGLFHEFCSYFVSVAVVGRISLILAGKSRELGNDR